MKDGVKGDEWVDEIETWEPSERATGDEAVLFMRRCALDEECGFSKDKMEASDRQSGGDREASGGANRGWYVSMVICFFLEFIKRVKKKKKKNCDCTESYKLQQAILVLARG